MNILNTHDLLIRWKELSEEVLSLVFAYKNDPSDENFTALASWFGAEGPLDREGFIEDVENRQYLPYLNNDQSDELWELNDLFNELRGLGRDLEQNIELIEDSSFEGFARQKAEDLGVEIDEWPATAINWKKAVGELQQDYSKVEFMGEEYWYRK